MKFGVKQEMICNKYANTVGTENELRYVIGVTLDRPMNTLRRSKRLQIHYNMN